MPIDCVGSRRSLLGVALAAALWSRGHAQETDARQPVVDLYAALQAVMRMGRATPFKQRFDQLAPVIDRDFDIDTILRSSVGLRWPTLDDASRQTLFAVFRAFTIASYTANFNSEGGERLAVLPRTRMADSDVVAESTLTPANGEPIRIDYVVRRGGAGWRIVDVLLDGSISRVAVQRSDFRALLASGSPAALIDSLKRKVVELSGGSMRL